MNPFECAWLFVAGAICGYGIGTLASERHSRKALKEIDEINARARVTLDEIHALHARASKLADRARQAAQTSTGGT